MPLTGGVQGKYYTDVNHLATQLADKLGGTALLLHAPLFAESREQRDTLMEVGSIRQVFDLARRAQVALVGIGSITTEGSSYHDLVPVADPERELLLRDDAVGEFLAHLIRDDGSVADSPLNSRLVALNPAELATCPNTIGVAAGPEKVQPIRAALAGGLISSLIVDDATASSVLRIGRRGVNMSPEMQHAPIGSSAIEASVVGLGTWAIGGWMWGGTDEAESVAAIQASLDEGVSLIDTAPAYGQGRAEEIVGKAIRGRRDEVVLATKCGLVWHTQQGDHFFDYDDGRPVHRYLGKDRSCTRSSRACSALAPTTSITTSRTGRTPRPHRGDGGGARHASGSRQRSGRSERATCPRTTSAPMRRPARSTPSRRSTRWSSRDIETTLLPIAAEHGISTLSYSSLALGLLSGRMGPERNVLRRRPAQGQPPLLARQPGEGGSPHGGDPPVAEAHAATVAQVVIAWTVQQPGHHLCAVRRAQSRPGARERRCRPHPPVGRRRRTIDDAVTST